jgi:Putative abortive phage resistance protein AbiGi, antitoxin
MYNRYKVIIQRQLACKEEKLNNGSPGTVSKILWHFTGGPVWNSKTNKQGKQLKPSKEAFENLKAIIRSRTLKVGRFQEHVNVVLSSFKEYSPSQKHVIEIKNRQITMHSSSVCCLADIPAVHLGYHATRYGKFAIGFHRVSVVQHGFNPVLYTLPTTEVIRHIYEGLSSTESIDSGDVVAAAESIEYDIMSDLDEDSDISIDTSGVVAEAEVMEGYAQEAQSSIRDFIAFIKTFEADQFDTIYCEREWRSVQDFKFTFDDVAMIVAPKLLGGENYFQDLVEVVRKLNIPRKIPIVPWEDLVEN